VLMATKRKSRPCRPTRTVLAMSVHSDDIQFPVTCYNVRFEVLSASSMKMTVLWDAATFSLIEVYRRFRASCCLLRHDDDGRGSKHLWKDGKILPDYTTRYPKKQSPSNVITFLYHTLRSII
jgi:hypothetical protein